MTTEIRPVGPGDLAEWRRLRLVGLESYPESFLTTAAEERARSDETVREMLGRRDILGLFDGAELIGTAALDPETMAATAHRVWLNSFGLAPDRQRQGHGRRLLAAAISRAKDRGFLQCELHVAADNAGAIALYAAAGFVETGRLPRAVCIDGVFQDDLHMVLMLDGDRPNSAPGPAGA